MSAPSSLSQGLALLRAAVDRERSGRIGHNAARLADVTGIERSRVSRLTQELRSIDYLQRDDTAELTAGPAYFGPARALDVPWLQAARRELRALATSLGVTAAVSVADGPRALLLRFESGTNAVDASMRPGMVTPIWCTGAGRALLWDHDAAQLQDLLETVQFIGVGGPTAARTVVELEGLLGRDRAVGVIRAADEYVAGLVEYALPIRRGGSLIASVSVAGSTADSELRRHADGRLRAVAERLSGLAETSPA
ncbi:MAG TPA: IclR family transcriptional regulator C-terminal domain-containing protein [Plantibacter sp.]|uniref:IclR family transcriptional regulator domain-containing protein n=1 Tax=unclassified Plantibacter TaxID=2624265 RepID=UPI002C7217AA|nr:IclR family transcriptional regulator C-terminal domain-containing protein [Plantibacter sp.]